MPQYALRTVRYPVNNPCHNFPLRTPPQLVASLCGLKFPYRRRTPTPRSSMFGLRPKGPSDFTSPHHASYWPISLLKAEAFNRSKSRSPVAA
jgi:hypothetical protein